MKLIPRICLYAFLGVLAALALLCGCSRAPEPGLTITAFSVGKADAILVQSGEAVMLIDCGEKDDAKLILAELKSRNIDHIDILQITHFDKDHVGGAAQIMQSIGADRVIYPDYAGSSSEYAAFAEACRGMSGAEAVSERLSLTLGDAQLTVIPADDPENYIKDEGEYDNEMSLVTRLVFGEKTFLFCADAEKKRLTRLLRSGEDLSCDWIKIPHHGKWCKQLTDFLGACSPEYGVMTVSEKEPADEKTIELLNDLGITVFDTLGRNVVTVCDGKNITVNK